MIAMEALRGASRRSRKGRHCALQAHTSSSHQGAPEEGRHPFRVIHVRPQGKPHPSVVKAENGSLIDLMVVAEAAGALRLSRKAVYELLWSGVLGYVRIGRRIRVPREELRRFVQERLVSPSSIPVRREDPSCARKAGRPSAE